MPLLSNFFVNIFINIVNFVSLNSSFISVSVSTNCAETYDDSTMILSSPINLLNNEVCSWKITAPSEMTVHLRFIQFSLERSEGCEDSSLQIFDGPNAFANSFGDKFCGDKIPDNIESTGSNVFILFRKAPNSANENLFQIKVDEKGSFINWTHILTKTIDIMKRVNNWI